MTDERFGASDGGDEDAIRPADEERELTSDRPRAPIHVRDRRIRHDEHDEGAEAPGETAEAEATEEPAEERDEVEELTARLREAKRLAEERLDGMKRLKADLENYRRRTIREQTDVVERASRGLVERLLPVLDDFERAIESARSTKGAEGLVKGVELVHQSLRETLEAEGLERMDPAGDPFDPHDHEAVSSVPGDVEEATVTEVVRPGYRLKDRTLRPAMVHVTVPGEGEPEAGARDREEGE